MPSLHRNCNSNSDVSTSTTHHVIPRRLARQAYLALNIFISTISNSACPPPTCVYPTPLFCEIARVSMSNRFEIGTPTICSLPHASRGVVNPDLPRLPGLQPPAPTEIALPPFLCQAKKRLILAGFAQTPVAACMKHLYISKFFSLRDSRRDGWSTGA